MKRTLQLFLCTALLFCSAVPSFVHAQAQAQEPDTETVTFVKAKTLQVLSQETKPILGTDTSSTYQTISAELLDGPNAGTVITVDNDFLMTKPGDEFYFEHTVSPSEGIDTYAVSEPYRLPQLAILVGIFLLCLFIFGGKQGIRGLFALVGSFFFIGGLLIPGILHGYSPVALSLGIASLIIILGSYVTHGFNRTTTAAVVGMLLTIAITGLFAYFAIHWTRLTGFTSEEATYLNFDTHGSINFVGLLLGSFIIGLLGVLYDAAIGQAIAVEELFSVGAHLTRVEVSRRALRIGREHIGALVNTLAIAYVGVSMPLILLFATSNQGTLLTINQEVFATEIVRMMVGSIGLILAVPITTLVAVYVLSKWSPKHRGTHAGHRH